MDCAACGTVDELVYACQRCGDLYCATHHAHRYHDCEPELDPEPEPMEWPSLASKSASESEWVWETDPAADSATESESVDTGEEPTEGPEPPNPTSRARPAPEEAALERPRAQLYPQEVETAESTGRSVPPEADRPGYGPERFTADPVEPAQSVPEWFRRQTYVSLTVKVGLLAAFCNLIAFSLLGAALLIPLS